MGRGRGAVAGGRGCGTSTLRTGAGGAAAAGVGAGLAAAAGMGAGLAARGGEAARRSSCSDAVGITTLTALEARPPPCEFDDEFCRGGNDAAAASASAGCAALSGRARPLLAGAAGLAAAALGGPRGAGAGMI